MRIAFFWDITKRVVTIPHGLFGKTYRYLSVTGYLLGFLEL